MSMWFFTIDPFRSRPGPAAQKCAVCFSFRFALHFHILRFLRHFSPKLSSARWSPSCFSKVLRGMESPIARNFSNPPSAIAPARSLVSTRYTSHSELQSLHSKLGTPTFCTLHSALDMLHLTVLHPTLYALNFTLHTILYTLNFTFHIFHSAVRTFPSTVYTRHSTVFLYTWHSLDSVRFPTLHSALHVTPRNFALFSLTLYGTLA